jgi:hypothetical protein
MHKLITGLAAATALALSASAAYADCSGHNVTASSEPTETVTMSTYDGSAVPPTVETEKTAEATTSVCAEGDKDCAAATK